MVLTSASSWVRRVLLGTSKISQPARRGSTLSMSCPPLSTQCFSGRTNGELMMRDFGLITSPSRIQLDDLKGLDTPVVDNLNGRPPVLASTEGKGNSPVEMFKQISINLGCDAISETAPALLL